MPNLTPNKQQTSKVACSEILSKLSDYKENGGTKQAVKDEIYKLIGNLFKELGVDEDDDGSRRR